MWFYPMKLLIGIKNSAKLIFKANKLKQSKGVIALNNKSLPINQSLEKALQIIEVMASNKGPMRLQDISINLGFPQALSLRFLNTLMLYNYVNQDPETLRYSLSFKFSHIGNLVSEQLSIRDIVRPYLLELSEKCQESACLAIDGDMMVVYVDVVDGPDNMLKAMQRIGKRAPFHSTGVGKILLLNYNDSELDSIIKETGLSKLTKHTITTKEALISELAKVKEQGFALDDEECEIGARCIAAPIRDYTGKNIAAISVSGPTSRMTMSKINHISKIIKDYSTEISNKLGYTE